MNTRHFIETVALLLFLLSCPVLASVRVYTISAGSERLEFMPQPEKGYVVRTTEVRSQETGVRRFGIEEAATVPLSLPRQAKPIGGVGRRGLWVVEDEQPGQVTKLNTTQGQQVSYLAPLFSSNGETVAIIPEIVVRVKSGIEIAQLEMMSRFPLKFVLRPGNLRYPTSRLSDCQPNDPKPSSIPASESTPGVV